MNISTTLTHSVSEIIEARVLIDLTSHMREDVEKKKVENIPSASTAISLTRAVTRVSLDLG